MKPPKAHVTESETVDDVDAAWRAEIKRRIGELDSGEVTAIPWLEARRMILGVDSQEATD